MEENWCAQYWEKKCMRAALCANVEYYNIIQKQLSIFMFLLPDRQQTEL